TATPACAPGAPRTGGGRMEHLLDYIQRTAPGLVLIALVFILARPRRHARVVLYILTFVLLRDAAGVCAPGQFAGGAALSGIRVQQFPDERRRSAGGRHLRHRGR